MHIYYSDTHRLHATGDVTYEGHPFIIEELPERAEFILQAVQSVSLGPVLPPTDFGRAPIEAVHDPDYLYYLEHVFAEQAALYGQEGPVFAESFATRRVRRRPAGLVWQAGYYAFGIGSPILAGTWTAAYWSAQCALSAAHWVSQQMDAGVPDPTAFALCRPPGHHAARDLYGGFCYLNNAAIAARYLGGQVAVLDIDYHHGNGTQEIFYHDPSVLFCSLHGDPDHEYPFFWGGADETGEGPGLGFNHNWPLPPGTDDPAYLDVLWQALGVIREFNPSGLVVSVGFDTLWGDPAGGFNLTPAGFGEMGRQIASLGLPTVIVLEGGYLLDDIGPAAVAFLLAFAPP